MPHYKYIAIVLVYRNVDDLKECVASFRQHISNCKIIVVNSFFDEASNELIKSTACQLGCDFVPVENKGYGAGNNAGIAYAQKNYTFDYLIISNPDVVLQQFDDSQVNPHGITAPDIMTLNGKKQNPLLPWDTHRLYYLVYQGHKRNCRPLCLLGHAANRLLRETFLLCKRNKATVCNVYGAHGSFFIISQAVLEQLSPLYDEHVFMFCEELMLSLRAKKCNISTHFAPKIQVLHKEDGSVKLSNLAIRKLVAQSNIYYYEHYVQGK